METSPILRGLPHSFEETAVLLSFLQHIKDLKLFFISLYVQVPAMKVEQQRTQSGPVSLSAFSGWPVCGLGMCIYFFSAGLWGCFQTTTPQLLLENMIHFGFFVWIHESRTSLSFLTLEQIWTHGFTFHYSYNRLFVLLCPVLFMEVTFCGYNNEVKYPQTFPQEKPVPAVYSTCNHTENILTFHCGECTVVIKWAMA